MPDVLVIDDSPTQLSVREALLRGAGFSVLTAGSAEEALELVRSRTVIDGLRVVLTDHVLPGAQGDALVRELRAFHPMLPVLVISGMHEAEQEYADLQITFLHKPCPPEQLIQHVREAVESSG